MWKPPKHIIKTGFSQKFRAKDQESAGITVCIDFDTGTPLYYEVVVVHYGKIGTTRHNFLTFEEAMMFCDINNYCVDTHGWDTYGLVMFYTIAHEIKLENGKVISLNVK